MSATLAGRLPAAAPQKRSGFLGKYREIVIAIALFLVLDLGVLALNFYISFQIADDAVGINLSGRQRMLSQRMTKALVTIEADTLRGIASDNARKELGSAATLFDETLRAFRLGGPASGGAGERVTLQAVAGAGGVEVLTKAEPIWTRYRELLAPVIAGNASAAQLDAAVAYGRDNNVQLLGLMNTLTTELEREATQRVAVLRTVQIAAILLALANFIYILFKFIRRLTASDAVAEQASEETRRILRTVREGLLLVDREGRIGSQMSNHVAELFGRPVEPGQEFIALLQPLVDPKALQEAREYVELLYAPHVREALVRDLNPLAQVEVNTRDRLGTSARKYLSFSFNRVGAEGQTSALLVTVQDVTARVELERALRDSKQQAGIELSALAEVLANDRVALGQFLTRCRAGLLEVNRTLEGSRMVMRREEIAALIDRAARRIHAIKGDASALRLSLFVDLAHSFEDQLLALRSDEDLTGDKLLAVPLPLDDMLQKVGLFERIVAAEAAAPAGGGAEPTAAPAAGERHAAALRTLAAAVAADLGKRVETQIDVPALAVLDETRAARLQELLVQLVRNAVAHGIEAPADRAARGKLASGLIQVWCRSDDFGRVEAGVRDDGAGLDPAEVRRTLVAQGRLSAAEGAALSDQQIVSLLLKPGMSTAAQADLHAGRGVGLDLVDSCVRELGGRLKLFTRPGQFAEFRVQFAA